MMIGGPLERPTTDLQTDGDVCPVCQTDRQFNKNLRLLVSPCYHKM
jgi:CDK-activating kinase assembly factor MAT1